MSVSLNTVHNVIKANIFSFLEKSKDFLNISQTCKDLYRLIHAPSLEEMIVLGRNYTQIFLHQFCTIENNPNSPNKQIFALLKPIFNARLMQRDCKITDAPDFEKKFEEKFSRFFKKFTGFFKAKLIAQQISNQQLFLLKNPDFVKAQAMVQSSFSEAITDLIRYWGKMPNDQIRLVHDSIETFLSQTYEAVQKQVQEEQKKIQEEVVKKQAPHSAKMKSLHDELLARVQPIAPIPAPPAPGILFVPPPIGLFQKVKNISDKALDILAVGCVSTALSFGCIEIVRLFNNMNIKIIGETSPAARYIVALEACITTALLFRFILKQTNWF